MFQRAEKLRGDASGGEQIRAGGSVLTDSCLRTVTRASNGGACIIPPCYRALQCGRSGGVKAAPTAHMHASSRGRRGSDTTRTVAARRKRGYPAFLSAPFSLDSKPTISAAKPKVEEASLPKAGGATGSEAPVVCLRQWQMNPHFSIASFPFIIISLV